MLITLCEPLSGVPAEFPQRGAHPLRVTATGAAEGIHGSQVTHTQFSCGSFILTTRDDSELITLRLPLSGVPAEFPQRGAHPLRVTATGAASGNHGISMLFTM